MGAKEGNEGKGRSITVVLNVDLHCGACAKKVKRAVRLFEGVESADTNDNYTNLTVVGKVDPEKLRAKVEQKIHKKVVVASPLEAPKMGKESDEKPEEKKSLDPPKEKENSLDPPKEKEKANEEPKEEDKAIEKKPKEEKPEPLKTSTVLLKIRLHCDGCIKKIERAIRKIKGVDDVVADVQRDLVMVKGSMDAASLPTYLQGKLKKCVEIVAPPPSKKEGGGGKKKETGNGGDKVVSNKSGEVGEDKGRNTDGERGIGGERSIDGGAKKKKEHDEKNGSKNKDVSTQETVAEVSKMEYYSGGATTQYYNSGATTTQYHHASSSSYVPMQQYYDPGSSSNAPTMHYYHNGIGSNDSGMQQYYHSGDATRAYVPYAQPYPYHVELDHQTQLFSDENPNACSVM